MTVLVLALGVRGAFSPALFARDGDGLAKTSPLPSSRLQEIVAILPGCEPIATQAFSVFLRPQGDVSFIPSICSKEGFPPRFSHFILKDRAVLATLKPADEAWNAMDIKGVAFLDLNNDGRDDIALVAQYWAGPGGPGVSPPFLFAEVYFNDGKGGFAQDRVVQKVLGDERIETLRGIVKRLKGGTIPKPRE